jgi:hypothetical protein
MVSKIELYFFNTFNTLQDNLLLNRTYPTQQAIVFAILAE